jgi:hypothetical protein
MHINLTGGIGSGHLVYAKNGKKNLFVVKNVTFLMDSAAFFFPEDSVYANRKTLV